MSTKFCSLSNWSCENLHYCHIESCSKDDIFQANKVCLGLFEILIDPMTHWCSLALSMLAMKKLGPCSNISLGWVRFAGGEELKRVSRQGLALHSTFPIWLLMHFPPLLTGDFDAFSSTTHCSLEILARVRGWIRQKSTPRVFIGPLEWSNLWCDQKVYKIHACTCTMPFVKSSHGQGGK